MDNLYNPSPIDREIKVNPSLVLMCKINKDGIIEYINHAFSEISGYEEFEIIGEPMDLLRHPDMPMVIYEMLKERFESKEPVRLLNKILAKDGRYFWVITDFETKTNDEGNVVAHYSHSFAAPIYAVHKVDSLYKILSNIELKSGSIEVSKRYLVGFLEERNLTYNQFMEELSVNRPEFEETFPTNDFIAGRPQPISKAPQEMSFNQRPNVTLNTLSQQAKTEKPKKQKSLLKKVFGK